jgi:hypothetical protein
MAGAGSAVSAAAKLAATAARIFGTVLGTTERSGRKVLARPLIGDRVAEYYGQKVSAADPLYEDPLDKRCAPAAAAGVQRGIRRRCVVLGA